MAINEWVLTKFILVATSQKVWDTNLSGNHDVFLDKWNGFKLKWQKAKKSKY